MKKEERHILQEELEYLRKLYEGRPVHRRKYVDYLQNVLGDVLVLKDVTRFYLG